MSNIGDMMQKAQVMKQKMEEMQVKVLDMEVEGQAGAGMVKIVANGKGELKKIDIDPSVIDPSEKELLEDLIIAAVNDAKSKGERMVTAETQKIMTDMGLPAGLDLPF